MMAPAGGVYATPSTCSCCYIFNLCNNIFYSIGEKRGTTRINHQEKKSKALQNGE